MVYFTNYIWFLIRFSELILYQFIINLKVVNFYIKLKLFP